MIARGHETPFGLEQIKPFDVLHIGIALMGIYFFLTSIVPITRYTIAGHEEGALDQVPAATLSIAMTFSAKRLAKFLVK